MPVAHDDLMRILAIGHDTSMRGEGISLRDAMRRSRYQELRKYFSAADLVPMVDKHRQLVSQWTMYSEDKRTSGGFALSGVSPEAVADYVVRELDFWASLE